MSDIEDILLHAWNKDAVNLVPALDSVMQAKASEQIQALTSSIASSMFGATVGNDLDQPQYEEENTTEEPTDEE